MHELHQVVGHLQLLGHLEQFVFGRSHHVAYLALHLSNMAHSLYHVTRSGFAFRANHRCSLGYAAQGLAQIACSTHERHVETCLVDMVDVIGR